MISPFRLALATGFVLVSASSIAPVAVAQRRSQADARIVDNYRLTMPMLRKVLPALYAPGAERCPQNRTLDPHTTSIADIQRMLERCPPMAEALRKGGVPVRDGAIVFASLLLTTKEAALKGGKASDIAPGVLRDNALLLERNDPELRRLMKSGAGS